MKIALFMLALSTVAYGSQCPAGQPKEGAALVQIEHSWARALEQRDTATLACILADEFEDVGTEGRLTDRATTLAKAATHPAIHHDLSDLRAQVQGDFGYIRGLATAVDTRGEVVAKVRFTDIYEYREGRWQCVAGHESTVTGAGH